MYVTYAAGYTTKRSAHPSSALSPERNSKTSLPISNAHSAALIKIISLKKVNL